MKIRVDAQLSPAIAQWLAATKGVEASAVPDLGLRDAEDSRIFFAARQHGAVVMSKDRDFVDLVLRHGPPPPPTGNTAILLELAQRKAAPLPRPRARTHFEQLFHTDFSSAVKRH